MMVHGWDEKFSEGQVGERHVRQQLNDLFGLDLQPAFSRGLQRSGMDLVDVQTGKTYEVKTCSASERTGNVFIELWSKKDQKPGWAHTSKADWLLYFFPWSGELLCAPMPLVRWFAQNRWCSRRRRHAQNATYQSAGVCPSIARFRADVVRKTVWIEPISKTILRGASACLAPAIDGGG